MLRQKLPLNQFLALINANNPSDTNPFLTVNDLLGGVNPIIVTNFSALPLPSSAPGAFYWVENSQGTWWLPGTLGGTFYAAGLYYSNGTSWITSPIPWQATLAEVNAGTNNDTFVTPYTFENANKWNTKYDSSNPLGFETPAQLTVRDNANRNRANHTGTQSATTIVEDSTHRFATDAEKTTWNGKQNTLGFTPENISNKGSANGYAPLGADSKVPSTNSRASSVIYTPSTGNLAFTWADGSTQNIDLPIENLLQNASYDSGTQTLTVVTAGGGSIDIDLSTLVDLPEIVLSASSNPSVAPTTGQKLFIRQDNGAYWTNLGGAWVGGYLGVTSSEKSTWNGKQDPITLVAGTNLTITESPANTFTFNATGGGGSGLSFQEVIRMKTILNNL
jgi:hypothetical protein